VPHPAWYLVLGALAGRPDVRRLIGRKKGLTPGRLFLASLVLVKGFIPVFLVTALSSGPMLPVAAAVSALLVHMLTSGRRDILWFLVGATLGLHLWVFAGAMAVVALAAHYVAHRRLLYLAAPLSMATLLISPGRFSEDVHSIWIGVSLAALIVFLSLGVMSRHARGLGRLKPVGWAVVCLMLLLGFSHVETGRSGFQYPVFCPQVLLGSPAGTMVALTFDDGPDPLYTPQVLELLKTMDVKATFFVVGSKVDRHPEIVAQIAADGHTIGNHSYSHRNLTRLSTFQLVLEIDRTQDAIERACGQRPHLFRPPRGMGSPELFRLLAERDMTLALWSKSSYDWVQPGPSGMVSSLGRAVKAGDILLFHDSGDFFRSSGATRVGMLRALPGIIVALRNRGLHMATMDEMIEQALASGWDMGAPVPVLAAPSDDIAELVAGAGRLIWPLQPLGGR
jgi:peptidoglycan-N-acetylglucosamine deacetylase